MESNFTEKVIKLNGASNAALWLKAAALSAALARALPAGGWRWICPSAQHCIVRQHLESCPVLCFLLQERYRHAGASPEKAQIAQGNIWHMRRGWESCDCRAKEEKAQNSLTNVEKFPAGRWQWRLCQNVLRSAQWKRQWTKIGTQEILLNEDYFLFFTVRVVKCWKRSHIGLSKISIIGDPQNLIAHDLSRAAWSSGRCSCLWRERLGLDDL